MYYRECSKHTVLYTQTHMSLFLRNPFVPLPNQRLCVSVKSKLSNAMCCAMPFYHYYRYCMLFFLFYRTLSDRQTHYLFYRFSQSVFIHFSAHTYTEIISINNREKNTHTFVYIAFVSCRKLNALTATFIYSVFQNGLKLKLLNHSIVMMVALNVESERERERE